MPVKGVYLTADCYSVCLAHALTTEKEEIMGLLIGEVCQETPQRPQMLFCTECLRLRLGVAISRMLRLRAACYWLSACQRSD